MKSTGRLYYVEWNGKFYYSDEVKTDRNSDLKNSIVEYGHITKSMLDELIEKYVLSYGVEVEDDE